MWDKRFKNLGPEKKGEYTLHILCSNPVNESYFYFSLWSRTVHSS